MQTRLGPLPTGRERFVIVKRSGIPCRAIAGSAKTLQVRRGRGAAPTARAAPSRPAITAAASHSPGAPGPRATQPIGTDASAPAHAELAGPSTARHRAAPLLSPGPRTDTPAPRPPPPAHLQGAAASSLPQAELAVLDALRSARGRGKEGLSAAAQQQLNLAVSVLEADSGAAGGRRGGRAARLRP
jgi:hypothetical protein